MFRQSQAQELKNVVLAFLIEANFTVISSEKILHDLNGMMVNMCTLWVGTLCIESLFKDENCKRKQLCL